MILRIVESCVSLCIDKMCLMPAAPLLRIAFIEQSVLPRLSSVCWEENLTDVDIGDNLATQLSGRLLEDNLK